MLRKSVLKSGARRHRRQDHQLAQSLLHVGVKPGSRNNDNNNNNDNDDDDNSNDSTELAVFALICCGLLFIPFTIWGPLAYSKLNSNIDNTTYQISRQANLNKIDQLNVTDMDLMMQIANLTATKTMADGNMFMVSGLVINNYAGVPTYFQLSKNNPTWPELLKFPFDIQIIGAYVSAGPSFIGYAAGMEYVVFTPGPNVPFALDLIQDTDPRWSIRTSHYDGTPNGGGAICGAFFGAVSDVIPANTPMEVRLAAAFPSGPTFVFSSLIIKRVTL